MLRVVTLTDGRTVHMPSRIGGSDVVFDVHEALSAAGLVVPLDLEDPEEVRRWVHCNLASMVEGCFDARLDPLALREAERNAWLDRLGSSYHLPDPREEDAWHAKWFGRPEKLGRRAARRARVQDPAVRGRAATAGW